MAVVTPVLLLFPAMAVAGHTGVGAGAPPNQVIAFSGSNSAGGVTFKLLIWSGPGLPTERAVGRFTFAELRAAPWLARANRLGGPRVERS